MRNLLSLFLLLAMPFLIAADGPATITQDDVRAHVEFLANDALEGRETGTRGHEVAATYVASRFRAYGLKPAVNGGWYQRVPFKTALVDLAKSKVSIAGQDFAVRKDVLLSAGRTEGSESITADVVFAGFCIHDPANGYDSFKKLNVKGKFVACLTGFPKGMRSDIGAHYGRSKSQAVQSRGGVGIVSIRTLERERTRPWAREIDGPQHPTLNWADATGKPYSEAPAIMASVTLHDKAAAALFSGSSRALESILAEADKPDAAPKGFALKQRISIERITNLSSLTSPNVIGMLPGSDPALSNEPILLMAHLDHIGIDESKSGDKINNGALDNASGTAAMLEAARVLAASPIKPRRPILFAAVTAEEKGLLGSDYLANNPVMGGQQAVAVVNLDMPILLYDFQDVVAFGAEHSNLGPMVEAAGAKLGVALSPDPLPAEGLFTRSDHYSHVKKGVPSVFLMTGFKNGGEEKFQSFLKTNYHRVSDDLNQPLNWNAAAKFALLNAEIAKAIANADSAPLWYADSFFGKVFAPNAPKQARPVQK